MGTALLIENVFSLPVSLFRNFTWKLAGALDDGAPTISRITCSYSHTIPPESGIIHASNVNESITLGMLMSLTDAPF